MRIEIIPTNRPPLFNVFIDDVLHASTDNAAEISAIVSVAIIERIHKEEVK